MNEQEFRDAMDRLRAMENEADRVGWVKAHYEEFSPQQLLTLSDPVIAGQGVAGEVNRSRVALQDKSAADTLAASTITAATEAGATPQQARQAAADATGDPSRAELEDTLLPTEILDTLGIADPSQEQVDQMLEEINQLPEAARRGQVFTSFDEVVSAGILDDPVVTAVVNMVSEGDLEPQPSVTISLLNGKSESILTQDAQAAQDTWGLRPHELARTVRVASSLGFDRLDGGVAWQPMAALFRAAGMAGYGDDEGTVNARKTAKVDLAIEIQELKDRRADMDSGNSASVSLDNAIRDKQKEYDDLAQAYTDNVVAVPTSAKNPLWTPEYLARSYEAGVQLYEGDDRLAYIHVLDPALAEKMNASGGDITKMSWQDAEQLGSLTRAGGFSSLDEFAGGMNALGMGEATGYDQMSQYIKSLEARLAAGGGGDSGRIRMKPDPVQLRQSAKDLYMSLYLEEPDDATLDSFAAQVSAAVAAAPDDVSVSVDAAVREAVEADPKHDQYYGNKPSGMMDMEFQGMHRSAQQSMLGAELAGNQPARVGMQQGAYQTTVGAAMGTAEAWDNSTFMGRLAKAAQVVGRNT